MRVRGPLALLMATGVLVLTVGSAPARADAADVAATQTYVQANYTALRVGVANLALSEAAPLHLLAQVKRECPGAGAGSPQDPESTQMSDEVIGAMYIPAIRPDLQAIKAALSQTAHLSWSDPALTRSIDAYRSAWTTMVGLTAPNLCADVKAWAESGYSKLPATTVAFAPKFMSAWVGAGFLPAQLSRYETAATRALANRSRALELQIAEAEARQVEHWGDIMDTLDLWP
ncbi:MAG TPA: hypothetical protein VED41_13285 [Solirubrobacteraceae bacterium]|nr:hypothetical protein [Solirubrobacteraceae bacterium]